MNRFSRQVCIVILAYLVAGGILHARSPADSKRPMQKVLIEAMKVQVGNETLEKLQVANRGVPSSEVTVPLATLIYVLADPNAVKVTTKQKMVVWVGQMGRLTTGKKLKYLVREKDGSLEQKITDKPDGTILKATPVVSKDGDILLKFEFGHFSVAPAKEIDPQTSLPIGEPIISGTAVEIPEVRLKPGEPTIVGGMRKAGWQGFVLVRAEILE